MGSLILPPAGAVYIDSVVLIYTVDQFPRYWQLLESLWQAADSRQIEVVSSELILLEVLVKPLKVKDLRLQHIYEQALYGKMTMLPINQRILRRAAELRASVSSLRTPDAIHAATAMIHGCAQFITNDHGYRQVPGLPLVILSELLQP